MTEKLSNKLGKVLEAIATFTNRIDNLEKNMLNIGSRLDDLKKKFNGKLEDIDARLNFKADGNEIEELKNRVIVLEKANRQTEASAVMKDSYEKRLNILIHGIPETEKARGKPRLKL